MGLGFVTVGARWEYMVEIGKRGYRGLELSGFILVIHDFHFECI